jgi:lyso-ornithine lipid O-acyltransferase
MAVDRVLTDRLRPPGTLPFEQALRPLCSLVRSACRIVGMIALLLGASLDLRLRRARTSAEGALRIHRWSRRIVRAIGISLRVHGTPPPHGAVVSNHLSYLDILLYSAVAPFVMVAKSEVRAWPLLGWFTAQAGTVYVQRGGPPSTYPAVNRAMTAAYRTGIPVLFFPEGTTTDGSEILPFRRGLFHSVLDNHVPLRSAALRYTLAEDNGDATVGEHVCWWGDAFLAPHLVRCLGLRGLNAEIRFDAREIDGYDRFDLSCNARETVRSMYFCIENQDGGCDPATASILVAHETELMQML